MLHMHHMPDTYQAYDVFFEKQGFIKVLMYLLESQMETNGYMMVKHCTLTPSTVCGRSPSLEEGGLRDSPVKASGLAVDWI